MRISICWLGQPRLCGIIYALAPLSRDHLAKVILAAQSRLPVLMVGVCYQARPAGSRGRSPHLLHRDGPRDPLLRVNLGARLPKPAQERTAAIGGGARIDGINDPDVVGVGVVPAVSVNAVMRTAPFSAIVRQLR